MTRRRPLERSEFWKWALLLWVLVGCGSVSVAPQDAGGGDAAAQGGAAGGTAGQGDGGSAGASGAGGGGTAGAACTPAVVKLTAGDFVCACGGTCAPCPVASGPRCGGTGMGHADWSACGGYHGCAQDPDGGALGVCCQNDCSAALCEP